MSPIILYMAFVEWYVLPVVALVIGIYLVLYYARLLDITRKQFLLAIIGGIALAALSDTFHYFTSTHMLVSVYNDIFTYTALTILSIIFVCLIYVRLIGRRNLKEKYNIDISRLRSREIQRLKELHR